MADKPSMGKGDCVPRIITDFAVELYRAGREKSAKALSVNLSETGVCMQTSEPLETGEMVRLEISIYMQTTPMEMMAKVVWVRPDPVKKNFTCGLGFVDTNSGQLELIRFYVQAGTQMLLDFFSEFPLFEAFTLEDCQNLIRIATRRELAKREVLYYENGTDIEMQGLFIVQSGLLAIFKGKKQDPQHQIAVVSPGQIFGENTLVIDQPHTASVMAINPSTLIQINKQGFQYLKVDHPKLALKFMEVIAQVLACRLGRTTKRLFSPIQLQR